MVRRRYSESALSRRAALFESRPRRRFREEDELEDDDMEFEGEDMEDEGTDEGSSDTVNIEMTEDEYKALVKFAKKAEKAGFSEADIDLEEARRRRANARAVLEAVRRARRYREYREQSMDARRRRAMLERRLAARKRIAEARMRRTGRR